jgi:hypothetical protein
MTRILIDERPILDALRGMSRVHQNRTCSPPLEYNRCDQTYCAPKALTCLLSASLLQARIAVCTCVRDMCS